MRSSKAHTYAVAVPGGWRGSFRIERLKGAEVGTVEAPDAESAIQEAIKKFEITDRERQKRITVWRVG